MSKVQPAGIKRFASSTVRSSSDRREKLQAKSPPPGLPNTFHEMSVFPNGKHDARVDSTATFLDSFKRPIPAWGIFELYKKRGRKTETAGAGPVHVKAPPGIGAVAALLGGRGTSEIEDPRSPQNGPDMLLDAGRVFIAAWVKLQLDPESFPTGGRRPDRWRGFFGQRWGSDAQYCATSLAAARVGRGR